MSRNKRARPVSLLSMLMGVGGAVVRKLVLVGLLVGGAVVSACGGPKEPMVPDGPEMNVPEAGIDDPAASATPSATPATPPTPPAK